MAPKEKRFPLGIFIYMICFLLFLFIFIYSIYVYVHLERTKQAGNDEIERFLLDKTNIEKIENIYHFQSKRPYKIVYAKTKENEERILFIDLEKPLDKDAIRTLDRKKFMSQQEIEANWKESCHDCTLKRSQPAYINEKPLWEITHEDEEQHYFMTYYSLEDGSLYEQMKFTRKYRKKDD